MSGVEKARIQKQLKLDGLILLISGCTIFLFKSTGIGCPIRHFSGIPCPTCGMTRSFLALFQGHLEESLYYHALTIPTVVVLLIALHESFFPMLKGKMKWIEIALGVLIFIYYLYRLFFGLIP